MRNIAWARAKAETTYKAKQVGWAMGDAYRPVTYGLKPPSMQTAKKDLDDYVRWVKEWRTHPEGVVWVKRSWKGMGTQEMPSKLSLITLDDFLQFSRKKEAFERFSQRVAAFDWVLSGIPREFVSKHRFSLDKLSDADFQKLISVVSYLLEWDDTEKVFARELGIRGVDTKWLEKHKRIVKDALEARGSGAFSRLLFELPNSFSVRYLDGKDQGGVALSIEALAEVPLAKRPKTVLVVENGASFASVGRDVVTDCLVIWGHGFTAVKLADVKWLHDVRLIYWGDIDAHGMAILGAFKEKFPETESFLMDEATLEAFSDLVVEAKVRMPSFEGLSGDEISLAYRLAKTGERLEQERIEADYVDTRLREVLGVV